jgi:hypothetical protein
MRCVSCGAENPSYHSEAGQLCGSCFQQKEALERDGRLQESTTGGASVTNNSSSGPLTGILMIVGAIIWFVVGLSLDRIFFYPPVLLILGIISIVKSSSSNS